MSKKILISRKTQQSTKLAGLGEVLEPAKDRSLTDTAFSTMSSADSSSRLAAEADIAVVDGEALRQNDGDEHHVLATALALGLPIVMEKASADATAAIAGVGVDADAVVIRPAMDVDGMEIVVLDTSGTIEMSSDMASSEPTGDTGPQEIASAETGLDSRIVAPESVETQVLEILSEMPEMAPAATAFATPAGEVDDKTWQHTSKITLPVYKYNYSNPSGQQTLFIKVDFKVSLYATSEHKYMVVELMGTGFSAGSMVEDLDYARRAFQGVLGVRFGPGFYYRDFVIEELNPKNQNHDGSWSVTTGFEVGISASSSVSDPFGLSVSASYNRSQTTSMTLQDFDIVNQSNDLTADFVYRLAMVDGHPYKQWEDLIDKTGLKWKLRNVPILAKKLLTPRCEVVWRCPADFNQRIVMGVSLEQYVCRTYRGTDDKWHYIPSPHKREFTFEVDFGTVQVPSKLPESIPNFAARVLVEYKPKAGEILRLRSLGDGSFEILEDSTIEIPPQKPPEQAFLAKHTVRAGESLSLIALRYYGSGTRDEWMRIYQANRAAIGDNPSLILPGQILIIPRLDADGATPREVVKPRHKPTPRPKPIPRPNLPKPKDTGAIVLLLRTTDADLWNIVQWQDSKGGWHPVTGWQGTLDKVSKGVGWKQWAVESKELGKGPFRWRVFQKKGGRLLATSESFSLPQAKGEMIFVEAHIGAS